MPPTNKDYYKILQVDPSADPEIIVVAYKRLARIYHPDINKAPDATLRMQEIITAYEILHDPVKRTQYDKDRSSRSLESDARYTEERRKREGAEAAQRRATNRRSKAIQDGELTDWNAAAAEVIKATNGLVLTVRQRQRSEGRNKASRFIRFGERLSPYQGGQKPILKLKPASIQTPGRVSLEVPHAFNDRTLRARATDAGFQFSDTDRRKSGTLVISESTPYLQKLTISKSVADQIRALEDAADVAQRLIEWWENRRGAGALSPRPGPIA